ncbi:hypothetical protein D3C86_2110700 [compost metagenome]
MFGAVIVGHLVADLAIRCERAETVGKTGRYPELPAVLGRQFQRDMLSIGR